MKRFLILTGLCMFMACMASAAPPYVQEVPQSVSCIMQGIDVPTIVADIEYAYIAYDVPAQVQVVYTSYQAAPVEVLQPKFNLNNPVFRLCRNWVKAYDSYIMIGKLARNNLPPNRWARHALEE